MNLLHIQNELDDYNKSFKMTKNKEQLNKEGQFPTPSDLASEITQYILSFLEDDSEISFLEPALGAGSFYSALLQSTNNHIKKAIGIEKDEELSKYASNLWKKDILKVINKDFTQWEDNEKFNLVITNPPYVRHHHLSVETKKDLQLKALLDTGIKVSGYAGLYVYFMLLTHKFLEKGAVSAWLIPAEFMSVNYGSAIRDYLTNLVQVKQIHQYDIETSKFDDALVSSAVVIFSNEMPKDNQKVNLTYGGSIDRPDSITKVSNKELFEADKWISLFRRNETVHKKHNKESKSVLGDFFTVKRGIATGNNDFFVMPWSKAKELNIPPECYKFVLPSSKKITSNVIEAGEEGEPLIDEILVVIDTDLDKATIKATYPDLYNYLKEGIENGANDRYLLKKRKIWYKQEERKPSPFLCTYMARKKKEGNQNSFRFIRNKSNAIVTNNYLMLYPKPELEAHLDANPELYEKVYEVLNQINENHFTNNGREYGGGLKKIEPKELANLPVGDLLNLIKEK